MADKKIRVERDRTTGAATAWCPQCGKAMTIKPKKAGEARSNEDTAEVAVAAIKGHLIARHGAALGEYF